MIQTKKFAVVTLYSYFPALFDHTIRIACELVRTVNASVTIDLIKSQISVYFAPHTFLYYLYIHIHIYIYEKKKKKKKKHILSLPLIPVDRTASQAARFIVHRPNKHRLASETQKDRDFRELKKNVPPECGFPRKLSTSSPTESSTLSCI